MMDKRKREALQAAGWKGGSVADFLQLTPEQSAIVELKLKLSNVLRKRRQSLGWSQKRLAEAVRTSQSRVAKMEAEHDVSTSLDALFRALFSTGLSIEEVWRDLRPLNYVMGRSVTSFDVTDEIYSLVSTASNSRTANWTNDVLELT